MFLPLLQLCLFLLTFLCHFTLSPVRNTLKIRPWFTSESWHTSSVLHTFSTQIHTEYFYIIGLSRGTNKVRDKSLKSVSQTYGHLFVKGLMTQHSVFTYHNIHKRIENNFTTNCHLKWKNINI